MHSFMQRKNNRVLNVIRNQIIKATGRYLLWLTRHAPRNISMPRFLSCSHLVFVLASPSCASKWNMMITKMNRVAHSENSLFTWLKFCIGNVPLAFNLNKYMCLFVYFADVVVCLTFINPHECMNMWQSLSISLILSFSPGIPLSPQYIIGEPFLFLQDLLHDLEQCVCVYVFGYWLSVHYERSFNWNVRKDEQKKHSEINGVIFAWNFKKTLIFSGYKQSKGATQSV